jgi:hypothetical protein
VWLHASKPLGDGRSGTLVYFYVDNVDAIADELGVTVHTDRRRWPKQPVSSEPKAPTHHRGDRELPL